MSTPRCLDGKMVKIAKIQTTHNNTALYKQWISTHFELWLESQLKVTFVKIVILNLSILLIETPPVNQMMSFC